ncbi:MAG: acyl-CoA thioesterase [Limnochordales bacterium]|nr:thioesterase family protein [Limnochordales bacterium]
MGEISGVYRFRVRYSEADQMGITYYANYLDWFTIGRTELLRELGLPYARLEREGLLLPVLAVRCRYVAPTRYDDPIRLETTLTQCTRTRMAFRYRVVVEGEPEQLAAEGETEHAFIDRQYRPIDIKKRFPEVWQRLSEISGGS